VKQFIIAVLRKHSMTREGVLLHYIIQSVSPSAALLVSPKLQIFHRTLEPVSDGIHLVCVGGRLHPAAVGPSHSYSHIDLDLSAVAGIAG
jgi:hypothetical protein